MSLDWFSMGRAMPITHEPWNSSEAFRSWRNCLRLSRCQRRRWRSNGSSRALALNSGNWRIRYHDEPTTVPGQPGGGPSLRRGSGAVHRHRSSDGSMGELRPSLDGRGTGQRGLPLNQSPSPGISSASGRSPCASQPDAQPWPEASPVAVARGSDRHGMGTNPALRASHESTTSHRQRRLPGGPPPSRWPCPLEVQKQ